MAKKLKNKSAKDIALEKDIEAVENTTEKSVEAVETPETAETTEVAEETVEEATEVVEEAAEVVETTEVEPEVEATETVEETVETEVEPEVEVAETTETVETAEVEEASTVDSVDKEPKLNNVDTKENDKKDKFTLHDFVWVTIGLVIGILLSYCIFNMTLNSAIDKLAADIGNDSTVIVDNSKLDELSGISTYNDPSVVLTEKSDIDNAKKIMSDYVNGLTSESNYAQVMVGEEQYVYYMYNSNGEVFSQDADSNYTEVFLNNGTVYKFLTSENELSVGKDIDVASILKNTISAIDKENVKLYEMDLTGVEGPAGREFRVDLVGEDAVKLIYSSMGDEFATEMIDSIKATIADWKPHIVMTMFIGENKADSYCYCLYVIDNTEYTNWIFQGYDKVSDWTLAEEWYTYNADSDTDGKQYSELINKLVTDIDKIMIDYANSKGWLTEETTETTASTEEQETTETETETTETETTETVETEDKSE